MEQALSVSEDHNTFDVCVNASSPGIQEQFFIKVSADNEIKCRLYIQIFFFHIHTLSS